MDSSVQNVISCNIIWLMPINFHVYAIIVDSLPRILVVHETMKLSVNTYVNKHFSRPRKTSANIKKTYHWSTFIMTLIIYELALMLSWAVKQSFSFCSIISESNLSSKTIYFCELWSPISCSPFTCSSETQSWNSTNKIFAQV